jgi:hypothetical protein
MWHDVKHPKTGRLLFRFDPERMLIQIQQRGDRVTIDLAEYQPKAPAHDWYVTIAATK